MIDNTQTVIQSLENMEIKKGDKKEEEEMKKLLKEFNIDFLIQKYNKSSID